MQNFRAWRAFRPNETPTQLLIASAVGILLGVAIVALPPAALLALVGGIIGIVLFLKRPEVGILGILVLTGSVVFEDMLPLVPIPVGSLHIPDVIMLALFGLVMLRWFVEEDFKLVRTPLDLPLLAWLVIMLVSTVNGLVQGQTDFNLAFREIRVQSYLLLFFAVTNLIREKRQLIWLIRGFFGIALLVAIVMMAQFMLGEDLPLLPGRVEVLNTEGESFSGITRILPPGQGLVLIGGITMLVVMVFEGFRRHSLWRMLQVGLLLVAVIMTFNRNFWVALVLALMLIVWLTRGRARERSRLFQWAAIGLALIIVFLIVIALVPDMPFADLAYAAFDRFASLFEADTFQSRDSSFRWRDTEYHYALPQILNHPLLGLGMGARYRPLTSLDHNAFDGRAYMHNGHLWVMVKIGMLGFGALAITAGLYLWRALKYWQFLPGPQMRGIVLGFGLTFIGAIIGSIVNPIITQWGWTTALGIMWGISELIILKGEDWGPLGERDDSPPPVSAPAQAALLSE
ncbi:MAG: O-antigen ligase family protein [Anaerolineae bacterium]|nr:O-antigen ligase family protein [Anaerolineae bacterium]